MKSIKNTIVLTLITLNLASVAEAQTPRRRRTRQGPKPGSVKIYDTDDKKSEALCRELMQRSSLSPGQLRRRNRRRGDFVNPGLEAQIEQALAGQCTDSQGNQRSVRQAATDCKKSKSDIRTLNARLRRARSSLGIIQADPARAADLADAQAEVHQNEDKLNDAQTAQETACGCVKDTVQNLLTQNFIVGDLITSPSVQRGPKTPTAGCQYVSQTAHKSCRNGYWHDMLYTVYNRCPPDNHVETIEQATLELPPAKCEGETPTHPGVQNTIDRLRQARAQTQQSRRVRSQYSINSGISNVRYSQQGETEWAHIGETTAGKELFFRLVDREREAWDFQIQQGASAGSIQVVDEGLLYIPPTNVSAIDSIRYTLIAPDGSSTEETIFVRVSGAALLTTTLSL